MGRRLGRLRLRFVAGFVVALVALVALFSYRSFAEGASLSVTPEAARQNDTVTLTGKAFAPGETVSVWITYPDYRVFGVAEVTANDDGNFDYPYLPDFLGAEFTPVGRYVYTAHGKDSGREVYAALNVAIGSAPGITGGTSVSASPGKAKQGSTFAISGGGFRAGETLAVWLRYPDGTVEDHGTLDASDSGSFQYNLEVGGAPVGRYAFTARGLDSDRNGIAEFELTLGDELKPEGAANLSVSPTADKQRNYADFAGGGFSDSEIISVWATLPDGSTEYVGDVKADDGGAFLAELYVSEQEPTGAYVYTAYGNNSERRATARFTLKPGP